MAYTSSGSSSSSNSDSEVPQVLQTQILRNYIPPKPDLIFIDEQVKSESVDVVSNVASSDVKTVESKHESVDVKNKGVYNTEETKPVRKNNFSHPIIEDWNFDDEIKVEFEPKVEVKTVRPSIEKIICVKTAREKEEKDRLKLKELMELSTKLFDRVLDFDKIKTAQAKEIADLKKRVKKLERKRKSRTLGMNLFKIVYELAARLKAEEQRRKPLTKAQKRNQLVLLVYKVTIVFNKVNATKSRATTAVRVSTAGWIKWLEDQDMRVNEIH
nr:hypothetical protein [Tanacetum cinerariifolium]